MGTSYSNAMLRIAFVSTQSGWYGGEHQLALLAKGLRRRGHECSVAGRADGALVPHLEQAGLATVPIVGRGRAPTCLWRIRKWLNRFRPDVIHFNDSHALTAGGIAALGLSIPLRVASRRVAFPIRSAFRLRYFADRVICVSRAVRDNCLRAGVDGDRLRVVHDGIDPAELALADGRRARRELRIAPDVKLLLTVAKLTDCKGHRYLLDALPSVKQAIPNVLLVCAGDGSLRTALEARARDLSILDHVRFVGFRTDVMDLIAAADVMVVPSHTEGLCSSIIAAMLLGCPVVASDVGGIPDLLSTGRNRLGWLVRPRDSAELGATLRRMLRSEQERYRRAELARMVACQKFTGETMVDQTLAVYQERFVKRGYSFSWRSAII
jgi:glycosyltransferase involved in cell wall biosynthesis